MAAKTLHSKIVLITGAGGGLGREMVRQFLLAGSHLILTDRSAAPLHQAVDATVASMGRVEPPGRILGCIEVGLDDAAGCSALFERCMAIGPAPDIRVNNAGITFHGSFVDIPSEKWEALMQINLLAPMRLTAKFLPAMIARGSGHIVNVSSVAGLVGVPGATPYCAAKFGLRGFSEGLAAEVNPRGVDVTAIYPYYTRTPILQSEHFGPGGPEAPPDHTLYDPAFVVHELMDGIRKRKLHVYPGAIPKQIDFLRRVLPWVVRRRSTRRNTLRPAT